MTALIALALSLAAPDTHTEWCHSDPDRLAWCQAEEFRAWVAADPANELHWLEATHPPVLRAIRTCESGDGRGAYSYTARNPTSSASGAWQFLSGTWLRWRGDSTAPEAYLASRLEQDRAARRLFAAQGTRPWLASEGCWS